LVGFDGTTIWVTSPGSGTVSKINTTTNTVTATVYRGGGVRGVGFDGTNIWVTNGNSLNGMVSKIPV
jgi:YVTN family beta-propeller protein